MEPQGIANGNSARTYKWPWFVALAVLAAIILAVLWMRQEIDRTRRIRDANSPTASH